jgi:hypothetical protein
VLNPSKIEQAYKEFTGNLKANLHDQIIDIDLKFLHESGLLNMMDEEEDEEQDDLTQYFDVIHGEDKATLYNEQFIVWIIPQMEGEELVTLVLIAINQSEKAHLEIVFTTRGAYNTPRHVLQVIHYYLFDILETENLISVLEKTG